MGGSDSEDNAKRWSKRWKFRNTIIPMMCFSFFLVISYSLMTTSGGGKSTEAVLHRSPNIMKTFWANSSFPGKWKFQLPETLASHQQRVSDQSKADIIYVHNPWWIFENLDLPVRSKQQPYLLWGHQKMNLDHCDVEFTDECAIYESLLHREDILWVSHDLRDHKLFNNSEEALVRGVTHPPRNLWGVDIFWDGNRTDVQDRKYSLTFRGSINPEGRAGIRKILKNAFATIEREDIVLEFLGKSADFARHQGSDLNRFQDLMSTIYSLIPAGQGRWTYRFIQAVGAGTIPVIVADGLTLPFEQLVDWEELVIRIPDEKANDSKYILERLTSDHNDIKGRIEKLQMIYDTHFSTAEQRWKGMMECAFSEIVNL